MRTAHSLLRLVSILLDLAQDALQFLLLGTRSSAALKAENIFLRKQLALYLERQANETFLGWHRKGFSVALAMEIEASRRPRLREEVQKLIRRMARENPTWGEERIAAELLLKLHIRVSPRTVRRYMPLDTGPRKRVPSQRWMTFVRNHAQAIVACDFFVVVTASFRVLNVFVLLEVGTRRIAHFNVTAHPTASWTKQQFREVMMDEQSYRFVLHDRDRIYSSELDSALKAMDLKVLKTPFQAPQANAFCERLIGTVRCECLDFLIPLNERHLRSFLKELVTHYNCVPYCPTSLCA